jgi:hypothetical protein
MSNRIQFYKNLPVSGYPDLQLCKFLILIDSQADVLYVHYRSLHRRSDFSEETTVKKGVELLQDLVATETFNNLQKLSNMRRLTA